MFQPIVLIAPDWKGEGMESIRYSGLEHVPACSTWPPPWLSVSTRPTLAHSTAPRPAAMLIAKPPAVSLVDPAPTAEDEAAVCRALELHLRLPPGFLRLYTPQQFRAKFLRAQL
jgi:hypothetical protein